MNKIHKLIEDKVREYATEVLPEMDLEFFDVTFRKENNGLTLRLVIDGEKAGLEECSKVSKELSKWLDENDIVTYDSYNLEVSTPGLDRPVRNLEEFKKYRGRYCKIVYKNNNGNTNTIKGYINNIDNEIITIYSKDEKKYYQVNINNIKKANLEVEF